VAHPDRLFWHALAAFLACPGTVALVVPWLLRPEDGRLHPVGLPPLVVGVALLLWCVRDFHVAGRGSLAPWAPPERLVTIGLYRFSRNPMYVAVLMILSGWALLHHSRSLWIYAAVVAIAFHLRIVFGEEPWLARTHGDKWAAYSARVPRWLLPLASPIRATRRGRAER
jgi:protein-S-isoprenylcysteine O-methyltransferase Ste14